MQPKTTRALLGGLILALVGWFAAQACFPILRPPAASVCYNDQGMAEPCPSPRPDTMPSEPLSKP